MSTIFFVATWIRAYREKDRPVLEQFFEALQDELVAMDDLRRMRRGANYGVRAADRCLREARGRQGTVLIAEVDGQPVGFAVGLIEVIDPDDAPDTTAVLSGWITELYVAPGARRMGVATRLVRRLERIFVRAGCDTVRIEVFAPNRGARDLYRELGYVEREVDLIRPLTRVEMGQARDAGAPRTDG